VRDGEGSAGRYARGDAWLAPPPSCAELWGVHREVVLRALRLLEAQGKARCVRASVGVGEGTRVDEGVLRGKRGGRGTERGKGSHA
jgi:hypothetical protein